MCIKKENVHYYYYNQRERHNRVHKIWILKLVCLSDKKMLCNVLVHNITIIRYSQDFDFRICLRTKLIEKTDFKSSI